MGNGLIRSAALFAAALLAACHDDSAPREASAVRAYASAAMPDSGPSPEYSVAGHVLRLVVDGGSCVVEHRASGPAMNRLTLDLHPPCHLLTWRQSPPRASQATDVSDGRPLGDIGGPMAWRYAGAKGVVVLAVIGDPVPEKLRASSLYRLREQQGMNCASSLQGILLYTNEIRLSKKREHAGVFCAELGLEEKDFWLLAHP